MVNGTRIIVSNVDASATLTITAGSGTIMPGGGSTDTIGPGRDVAYEYDSASTQWRGSYNTVRHCSAPITCPMFPNIATARGNLIPSSTIAQQPIGQPIHYRPQRPDLYARNYLHHQRERRFGDGWHDNDHLGHWQRPPYRCWRHAW